MKTPKKKSFRLVSPKLLPTSSSLPPPLKARRVEAASEVPFRCIILLSG